MAGEALFLLLYAFFLLLVYARCAKKP